MQQRKIPLRHCLGCNESKPKKELVRVVRSPEGEISLDLVGKKPGRGAYLCPSAQIPPEVYESIEREIEGAERGE